MRTVMLSMGILASLALGAPAAGAATGDALRTLHPSVCQTGGYGIAVKAKDLLVTCPVGSGQVPTVYELKNTTGAVVGTHAVSGLDGATLVALTYDAKGKRLLACATATFGPFDTLGAIDLTTNVFHPLGTTVDCTGGLEYDQGRKLWSTGYGGTSLHQIDTVTGGTIHTYATAPAPCGSSGVAVVGGHVLFATVSSMTGEECGLWSVALPSGAVTQELAAGTLGAIADLACDAKTFKATKTTALWTASALDSTIVARTAPGSGGAKLPACK